MADPAPKPRIVLVDDAVFMRRQLREILEGGGYDVVAEGEDGAAALELYETHRPDLMTLDLVMPRMSGVEALKELRRRHPEARVVVCSSVSDQPSIFEAIGLGARDYVLKPISPERILAAVAKALQNPG
jgi:two-component system chemotaxis response regulator CheY